MNCKNCKYYYVATIEHCGGGSHTEGNCKNPLLTDDVKGSNECPDNGVYATCDEGRGELLVGPNFGCIHFEQKINA